MSTSCSPSSRSCFFNLSCCEGGDLPLPCVEHHRRTGSRCPVVVTGCSHRRGPIPLLSLPRSAPASRPPPRCSVHSPVRCHAGQPLRSARCNSRSRARDMDAYLRCTRTVAGRQHALCLANQPSCFCLPACGAHALYISVCVCVCVCARRALGHTV